MFSAWSSNRLIVNWITSNEGINKYGVQSSYKALTICHTCMTLSSDTEQMTQGSLGFHEKSEILAVCPPWMNWWKMHRHNQSLESQVGRRRQRRRDSAWRSRSVETDQQLRRTVLSVLRRLLLADLAEVPHVEPPVCAAGGQDGLIVGRPLDLLEQSGNVSAASAAKGCTGLTAELLSQHVLMFVVLTHCRKNASQNNKGILNSTVYQCRFLSCWFEGYEFGINKKQILEMIWLQTKI